MRNARQARGSRFSLYPLLLMALIVAVGCGITATGLAGDLAIIREILGLT